MVSSQTGIQKMARFYISKAMHTGRMNLLNHTLELREVALCQILKVPRVDMMCIILPSMITLAVSIDDVLIFHLLSIDFRIIDHIFR